MILVDSTRSGKKIPDALSKTVPIWCAVVNRAIALRFPRHDIPWDAALYTPPATVSAQEHSQIASRIDGWARSLAVRCRFSFRSDLLLTAPGFFL